jgi:hypothetical protein
MGLHAQPLDPRYHSWPEIQTFLDSLSQIPEYETLFRVDTIGYSTRDQLPLLAAVISENVAVREDEPRVLFVGQVHAEEILGVEAVLRFIEELLDPEPTQLLHVNILRQNLEIWIIPTANPEGLTVVHEGLDVTYRKNKQDFSPEGPWPNGIFDYDPSIGNDIDGVDLNRNFAFNWVFGDSFLAPDPTEYGAHYDYYRGPAPWAAAESRALRDLALDNRFLFSLVWHSSRSGRLSEKVFTSWRWEETKYSPDADVMKAIGDQLATLIQKEDGSGTYLSQWGSSRNGKAHDWFYQATGCFQYLVECGTANIQPDSALIEDTVTRLLPAMYYLLDRAIGYNTDAAQIRGVVRDAVTGSPIAAATVIIDELNGGVLQPRLSDQFGRFRRVVNQGTYTVRVRKFGYEPRVLTTTANNSMITDVTIDLTPAPVYNLNLMLVTGDDLPPDPHPEVILQSGEYQDTLTLNLGLNTLPLPEGQWAVTVLAEGALPWQETVPLHQDLTYTVGLIAPAVVIEPDFSNPVDWPLVTGTWTVVNDTLKTQASFLYPNADSTRRMTMRSRLFPLITTNRLVVELDHRFELEWDYDSLRVQVLDGQDRLLSAWAVSHQRWGLFRFDWISATDTAGIDSVYLQLELVRDSTVNYRGWELAHLRLLGGEDPYLGVSHSTPGGRSPSVATISDLYPNPTTGMIAVDLLQFQPPVTITVYNLLGQQVYRRTLNQLSRSRQTSWLDLRNLNGAVLSSGVYFIHIANPQRTFVKKCVFLHN